VRLDVVGVAVEAVLVVGHQHLRPHFTKDPGQLRGGLRHIGLPETVRAAVFGQAHHPRVAPPAGPAEEALVGDAERGAGGGQLGDPVRAQAAAIRGEMGQVRRDDLAEFTQGAGDQGDLGTLRGVPGDGRPGPDRLVVGVGVHKQQPVIIPVPAHGTPR
jgi:hypothetical protein